MLTKRRNAKNTVIQIGDTVLLRQKKRDKFSTKFDRKPFKVTGKKGTMITAVRKGRYVTQNASMFKRFTVPSHEWEEEESDDDDTSEDDLGTDHDGNDTPSPRNVGNDGNPARRYPTRNRKRLNRYGQNIYEN